MSWACEKQLEKSKNNHPSDGFDNGGWLVGQTRWSATSAVVVVGVAESHQKEVDLTKKKEGDDQKRKRRTHSSPVGKEDSPNPKARNGSRRLRQPFLWRQVCGLHAPNKTACQSTWFPIWAQNCFAWVACDKAQPNPELAWKTGRWQLRRTWRTTMKVTRTRELDRSTRIPCKS